jgi:hypothetical protein
MTLSLDEPRCAGAPAGPSGHQLPPQCVDCARRLAPRPLGVKLIEPPAEVPCPRRIREVVDA